MYKFLNEVKINRYTQDQLKTAMAVLSQMPDEGAMFLRESQDIMTAVVAGLITEANASDISLGRFGMCRTKEGKVQLTMVVSSKSTGVVHGAMMHVSDNSMDNLWTLADKARQMAYS